MAKKLDVNADNAIKYFIKYSSLGETFYQQLIKKPTEISRLVRIALDPQSEGVYSTQYPLTICQIFENYPYLLLILFSVENNAESLFKFLQKQPNPTQFGYFSKIASLFTTITQQHCLKYIKQNSDTLCLLYKYISEASIFRFIFDCIILCQNESEFRSTMLIKLYKQIMEYSSEDIAKLIKDSFNEIIDNYDMIGTTVKQTICNIFNQTYVQHILNLIRKNNDHFLSQYCVGILNRVVIFFKIVKNQNQGQKEKQSKIKKSKDIDFLQIQKGVIQILKSLGWLSELLLASNMTIFKLRLSQFFKNIIKYFDDTYLLQFNFKLDELLKKLIKQISVNPWANMIHNQLTDAALLLIQRHTNWQQDIVQLLNDLMQLFKNRYFLFISSGKTTSLGNTHHFYLIIKKLAIQLQKHQKLNEIFSTFKPWKRFLSDDIRKYEYNMKTKSQIYPKVVVDQSQCVISNLIVRINQKKQSPIIDKLLQKVETSYVQVLNYTVWDKKKQTLL